jgi:serine/threonine-protein kinase
MSANRSASATFMLGSVKCVVPNVKGKTLVAARTRIKAALCALGSVKKAFSATVPRGRVRSQTPRPGKRLAKGGKVNLVVSKGKRKQA